MSTFYKNIAIPFGRIGYGTVKGGFTTWKEAKADSAARMLTGEYITVETQCVDEKGSVILGLPLEEQMMNLLYSAETTQKSI